ncbi:hypothetical protein LWP59_11235 [Amycolatopsis acidiphila]|uniref:Cell division protein FtsL n=1 Tax=Amycolatopsis acidiphila TaxID=715473 RepID=A0A558ABH6_9PSEU|nr:hypothetical protein [Amycolatopsis acidiphila]TVT21604.1 hypothetical protein FNH06_16705 [Amycolatopsis acidiphila]UIJ62147.1 hypothetical protein LWP59_11235 [Amycolatopsis acidiphila]GHG92109.1 hypothetical protein GCM10017788_68800 [Amycolatopsis acidiphila]
MTAPTRTRRKPAETPSRTATREATRTERRHTRGGQQRTTAAERAYARRAQRVDVLRRNEKEPQREPRKLRLRWPKSRASFVLIVMTLLAAGVATTLLLSTQAIADSYRLEQIRQENASLAEQSEQLQQGVTKAEAASSLANRAKALGMVPAGNPAHLVQNPDGSITVVGEPKKAVGQAPPPPAPPAPPPVNQNPAGQTTAPIEGDVAQGDEQQPPVVSAQAGGQ